MLFFTGDSRAKEVVKILEMYSIGRVVVNHRIRPYLNEKIIFDNGAYADRKKGEFNEERYSKSLSMVKRICRPYFAVTPDIYVGGKKSLEMSNSRIKQLYDSTGWDWYLVVQDGMNPLDVKMSLNTYPYTGVFIGGSNDFKLLTDETWENMTHKLKLKLHYGRCGTPTKIQRAIDIGADSIDSAFPLWTKERMENFVNIVKNNTVMEVECK